MCALPVLQKHPSTQKLSKRQHDGAPSGFRLQWSQFCKQLDALAVLDCGFRLAGIALTSLWLHFLL